MELAKLIVLSIFVFTIAFRTSLVASQKEAEDGKEFSYVVGHKHGPGRWGLINPEWELCNKGRLQSPIDLADEAATVDRKLGRIRTTYKPSRATLINEGHDIKIKWEGEAGGFFIYGREYALKQSHWHSPSEHTINGNRFDLELHLVHQSADNETAVIGILYKIGRPDSFLAKMGKYIRAVRNRKGYEVDGGDVDPRDVGVRFTEKYYRYLGSLTTPPCTEGVTWTVLDKVRTVSWKQLEMMKEAAALDALVGNARPVQDFNDRVLNFYRPFYNRY